MSDMIRQLTEKSNFSSDGFLQIEFLNEVKEPFYEVNLDSEELSNSNALNVEESAEAQVDEIVFFRQLQGKNEMDLDVDVLAGGGLNLEDEEEKNDYIQRLAK